MHSISEFKAAIAAARNAVTAEFRGRIEAADRAIGRTGSLGGHARWNRDVGSQRGVRFKVASQYWAALEVALAPIEAEWDALPRVSHDWAGGMEMSRQGVAVALPDGTHVHTDALHGGLRSRPWPVAALRRYLTEEFTAHHIWS